MIQNTEMIFRPIAGSWTQVNTKAGESARTLADTLQYLDIIIDDSAQFCRIYQYFEDYKRCIIYRAYNLNKITIQVIDTPYE